MNQENALILKEDKTKEFSNFLGKVFTSLEELLNSKFSAQNLYFTGEITKDVLHKFPLTCRVFVVADLSTGWRTGYLAETLYTLVTSGQLPRDIFGVAAFFPQLFDERVDFFRQITEDHQLQNLKLGARPGDAFRKGIYLTPVQKIGDSEELHFKLLRCSTNLDGPTENFRETDQLVVDTVNFARNLVLPQTADLNHVLAQVYHNSVAENGKSKKASISAHSDKTKDMHENGAIAFCTFYEGYSGGDFVGPGVEFRKLDGSYDYVYGKGNTVLTKLRFRLKQDVVGHNLTLEKDFQITLYPNSVVIIPLSTNRLYTHEIVPSGLPVNIIPTRIGFTIRSSKVDAVYKNGQNFIRAEGDRLIPLEPTTNEKVKKLQDLYFAENTSAKIVDYRGDPFFFSMNSGDYIKPKL